MTTNKVNINNWLNGADRRLVISNDIIFDVGNVIRNGSSNSQSSRKTTVVLERDPDLPSVYRVHTAFPDL